MNLQSETHEHVTHARKFESPSSDVFVLTDEEIPLVSAFHKIYTFTDGPKIYEQFETHALLTLKRFFYNVLKWCEPGENPFFIRYGQKTKKKTEYRKTFIQRFL